MIFQPLPVLAFLIVLGIAWSLFWIFRNIRRQTSFEPSFLSLVAFLNILAFLSGFSIGKLVGVVALLIGISLVIKSRIFKLEFCFSAIASLLLLLLMLGVPFVDTILLVMLFAMVVWEGWKSQLWTGSPNSIHAMAMLACLFEGTLILSYHKFIFLLPLINVAITVLLLIKSKKYLWQNFIIILANILWLLNITIYLK